MRANNPTEAETARERIRLMADRVLLVHVDEPVQDAVTRQISGELEKPGRKLCRKRVSRRELPEKIGSSTVRIEALEVLW